MPKDGAIAANFDGVDDYVAIPNEANYDLTGRITIACWIKVDVWDVQWQAIVGKGDSSWRLMRDSNNGGVTFACTGLSTFRVASTVAVNDGQWHHIAGVYTGTQLLIYIDGVLNNSVNSSGTISTNNYAVEIERTQKLPDGNSTVQSTTWWFTTEHSGDQCPGHLQLGRSDGPLETRSSQRHHGDRFHYYAKQRHVCERCRVGIDWSVPGAGAAAASFDAINDHVTTANEYLYDIRGPITVAAWIKVNAFTVASQAIVTKGNTAWRLRRNGSTNQVQFACNGLTDTSVNSTSNVNDGRWHHVVGVYTGTALRIYVDGVLEASDASTGPIGITTHNVYLGENAESVGRYWNGAIHDVRIYSVALSASQVAGLYGLVGHWKLSETSGTSASDSTAFASNGTVSGTANWSTTCNGTGVFDFDGSSNYINVSNSTHLQPTSAVTIAAWIKGDSWAPEPMSTRSCVREKRIPAITHWRSLTAGSSCCWMEMTAQAFAGTRSCRRANGITLPACGMEPLPGSTSTACWTTRRPRAPVRSARTRGRFTLADTPAATDSTA